MPPATAIPTTVAFEVLRGCNLGCFFCYLPEDASHRQHRAMPPLDTTLDILRRIRGGGVKELYLLGGEILLHPHFTTICQFVAELGFESQGIVTNGLLLDERRVSLLKRLGFWVDVSIRALTEQLHADITGRRGRVQEILRALRLVSAAGIELGIEFDCLPSNHHLLFETVEYLQKADIAVSSVYLHRIAPHGTAADHREDTQLSHAQYLRVLEQARRIRSELGVPATFEDGLPLCLLPANAWQLVQPCDCGWTLATIDPFGNVRRCACHSAMVGNLLTTELGTLWSAGLADFRAGQWMAAACRACAVLDRCRGGCAVSSPESQGHAPDVFEGAFAPINEPALVQAAAEQ